MLVDVIDSDLDKDPDYLVDYNDIYVCELRVVLLVFIALIMEFGSRDSVGKVYEELEYERTI